MALVSVICEIKEHSKPPKGNIKVRLTETNKNLVELEIDDNIYVVDSRDLNSAISRADCNSDW